MRMGIQTRGSYTHQRGLDLETYLVQSSSVTESTPCIFNSFVEFAREKTNQCKEGLLAREARFHTNFISFLS